MQTAVKGYPNTLESLKTTCSTMLLPKHAALTLCNENVSFPEGVVKPNIQQGCTFAAAHVEMLFRDPSTTSNWFDQTDYGSLKSKS